MSKISKIKKIDGKKIDGWKDRYKEYRSMDGKIDPNIATNLITLFLNRKKPFGWDVISFKNCEIKFVNFCKIVS